MSEYDDEQEYTMQARIFASGYVAGQDDLVAELLAIEFDSIEQLKVVLESRVNTYCLENGELIE